MNIRTFVPVQVGVVALLVGGLLFYLTLRDAPEDKSATVPQVKTTKLVSRAGGFSVGVPEGLIASKHGKTVQLANKDKSLVVTVGPAGVGSLTKNNEQFVSSLKAGYSEVLVLGHEKQKVDGRNALATYGQAVNSSKVKIRFVSLAVSAQPRDYSISTFTGFDTDPAVILPKVNAIVNTFKVLQPSP